MKKNIISTVIACLVMLWAGSVQASGDTIPGRYRNYYYTHWYDECPSYATNGYYDNGSHESFDVGQRVDAEIVAKYERTPQPLKIKGIAALLIYDNTSPNINPEYIPEYVGVFQLTRKTHVDSILLSLHEAWHVHDSMIAVDSARWDTAQYRIMAISQGLTDTVHYQYCYVFEAYFDKPATVDSVFFLWGTTHNHRNYAQTLYADILPSFLNCLNVDPNDLSTWLRLHEGGTHWSGIPLDLWHSPWPDNPYGYYLAIVDKFNIEVRSDNVGMGSVDGGGLIPDGWYDTISAQPNPGFRFTHWSDGSTENPRVVMAVQDTVFTAYFVENEHHTVQLTANNPDWGTVSGDGSYPYGSIVTISAEPVNDTFAFEQWNDGDWNNPRMFTLTQDTSFTAMFAQVLAIDGPDGNPSLTVTPNPAKETVQVSSDETILTLTIIDMSGRTVAELHPNETSATLDTRSLPSATYLVRITTNQGITVKKLVVE